MAWVVTATTLAVLVGPSPASADADLSSLFPEVVPSLAQARLGSPDPAAALTGSPSASATSSAAVANAAAAIAATSTASAPVAASSSSSAVSPSAVSTVAVSSTAGLDQIQQDIVDRLKQKAQGEIWRPGFEIWPSSNQLQMVGLKSWFRVRDDAWASISVDEAFAGAVAEASAPEPLKVQYEFSDGLYACSRQGAAWTPGSTPTGSCRRDWDHTTEVEPQQVRARLIYEFDWTLTEHDGATTAATGTFRIVGQWTDHLDLVVGELGTVVTDGTSASQPSVTRGLDMASATYEPPSGCRWGFLCTIARGFKSLWNWSQEAWDDLSSGVLRAAQIVWDMAVGCFSNILDIIDTIKDVLTKLKELAVDPIAFLKNQFETLKAMVDAVRDSPGDFAVTVLEGAFEAELFRTNLPQWIGKFACQAAVALLTGGGSLANNLGGAVRLIGKLNDYLSSKGMRNLDNIVPEPNQRRNDRDNNDGRDDDDEGVPRCLIGNSFPTGTPVRMADGTLTAIEDVRPGDLVLAADPRTGDWSHQIVLDQWSHHDDGHLATATLVDGSTITATDHHYFWVDSRGAWVELDDVEPGDHLLTPDGVTTVDDLTIHASATSLVWELDTSGPNTFTVHTGTHDLLVHNEDPSFDDYEQARNAALEWLEQRGFRAEVPVYNRFPESERGTKIIGWKTAEGNIGYRIEFDARNGAHINVFAGKEKGPHFTFPGDADLVERIIRRIGCR